nr:MAG TPA: hypothetical protein [Caudoviricetes sp.]
MQQRGFRKCAESPLLCSKISNCAKGCEERWQEKEGDRNLKLTSKKFANLLPKAIPPNR